MTHLFRHTVTPRPFLFLLTKLSGNTLRASNSKNQKVCQNKMTEYFAEKARDFDLMETRMINWNLAPVKFSLPKELQEKSNLVDAAWRRLKDANAGKLADPGDLSLRALTEELLEPLLQKWLSEHLEEIVQRRVEAEVQRISRLNR